MSDGEDVTKKIQTMRHEALDERDRRLDEALEKHERASADLSRELRGRSITPVKMEKST